MINSWGKWSSRWLTLPNPIIISIGGGVCDSLCVLVYEDAGSSGQNNIELHLITESSIIPLSCRNTHFSAQDRRQSACRWGAVSASFAHFSDGVASSTLLMVDLEYLALLELLVNYLVDYTLMDAFVVHIVPSLQLCEGWIYLMTGP